MPFFQNIANGTGTGGAVSNNTSDSNTVVVTLMNNTFAQNSGTLAAGIANWTGTLEAFSEMTMQNCIFWHEGGIGYAIEDGTPQLTSNGGNLSDDNSLAPYFTHPKDILLEEPTFVDTDDYDYHLTDISVGVNDGVDAGAPPLYLEGNPRNSVVDMGAYENQTAVNTGERVLPNMGLLSLSPNPATASSTKFMLANEWRGNLEIRVANVLGEYVYTMKITKSTAELHLDLPLNMRAGVYTVQVSNGSEVVVERLIRL
ncbi:MAG: T9SS type A sorting domain-containing protein [Saprospiraceae bacterium]|nr:T9SS type A sorting domain-containing protein [Saprospiraceae bacterium]